MYRCNSIRLSRYLYSLGFEKISKRDENGNEYWLFKRNKVRNPTGFRRWDE